MPDDFVANGRRGTDPHGVRYHLNPSPREFAGFFAGAHGAAFVAHGDDVAFGAGADGSIDHPTVARAFALAGEERFRGYMRLDGSAQLEVWTDAEDEASMTDDERARVDARLAAFLADPRLSRIAGPRELVVFSLEHGQPIVERDLPPCVPLRRAA